jgi:hypothetical protein
MLGEVRESAVRTEPADVHERRAIAGSPVEMRGTNMSSSKRNSELYIGVEWSRISTPSLLGVAFGRLRRRWISQRDPNATVRGGFAARRSHRRGCCSGRKSIAYASRSLWRVAPTRRSHHCFVGWGGGRSTPGSDRRTSDLLVVVGRL